MDLLSGLWTYAVPFLLVLGVLVFVHELGHYLVARWCRVRVEVFSIGFGPELFGWTDRAGTRWKVSAVPLGGYVKFFGDADAASGAGEGLDAMDEGERAVSFHHKSVGQRSAIVAAGPAANFLFAVVVLAALFSLHGQPYTPADIGAIQPGSAAEEAGLRPGDLIVAVDGRSVQRFEEVQTLVRLNPGQPMTVDVVREGRRLSLPITPRITEVTDRFGNTQRVGLLGVTRAGVEYRQHDPATAVWQAMRETWLLTTGTLDAVGQMIVGTRGTEELGGPLRIAQMSGDVAQTGLVALVWFMAVLSINLGLINLFPIPMLDGGHLVFYAAEAARGRPLGERAQEYGLRIGLALVLTLMVFATWNDLVHLRVVDFFRGLVS
jgi:regulator of sigma E protease